MIFRHDIDTDLGKAVRLAELEAELGISSTYFVLLTSDFYNVYSRRSYEALQKILRCGHELGLHFDETRYDGIAGDRDGMVRQIQREARLLQDAVGAEISTVSMHMPSRQTLDMDLQIPGMVNSYGKTFFHEFKYLSDSARRWREPVLDYIRDRQYDKLHILTHAFWYNDEEMDLKTSVFSYAAEGEAYRHMLMAEVVPMLYQGS